jgi:acyl carrier protein
VDRGALPEPEFSAPSSQNARPPESECELLVAELMARLLKIDLARLSATANFFELGGDSLKAIRFLSQLEQTFEIRVPVGPFIDAPTVAGIAALVEGLIEDADLAGGEAS